MGGKLLLIAFFCVIFLPIVSSSPADPGHPSSEIMPGYFEFGNFTFRDSLSVSNQLNASILCIGTDCRSSWGSVTGYDDTGLNLTLQALSESNTTTWNEAINKYNETYSTWSFNQSALTIGWVLSQGYVTSVSGYDDTSINATINSINTTQNLIGLGGGLNSTFTQYDTWNFNQSALTIGWVEDQGYGSSGGGMDYTNIAMTNQTNTFTQNQTINQDLILGDNQKIYLGSSYIYYNGTNLIMVGG